MTTPSAPNQHTMTDSAFDRAMLRIAARLAWRGTGGTAPNPRVGCVLVDDDRSIVGWGYHRACGGPHAEVVALQRAGAGARGTTAYVTLEPCNHDGRTGPCSAALIDAGVRRVVYAVSDPNPSAQGGAATLRATGIHVDQVDDDAFTQWVSAPFRHRVRHGRPWVIAKWAQTIDGKIATRTGESQWISGPASRRLAHRWRGQVDAVLTGIGTVLADDPQLTARDVRTRRMAKRIIIDPNLLTPLDAKLVRTARDVPTIIVTDAQHAGDASPPVKALREAGVHVLGFERVSGDLPLQQVLEYLAEHHAINDVLVDAGGGVLGRLFAQGLVNEARVVIAPMALGDELARPALRGMTTPSLSDGMQMSLRRLQRRGDDIVATYHVADPDKD